MNLKNLVDRVKRLLRREPNPPDDDPYAYVGAPKKPKPPNRRASAAAELD